jgi:tetratricopeptide (TPR) repeat protein
VTGASTSARRAARASLDAARPAVARLDLGRNSEDLAADLIESWSAVEASLRALVGGSALGGQALIRDARQRQLLDFDQANSLAQFHAVRERVDNTAYHPTADDINAARAAFLKLDTALVTDVPPHPGAGPSVPVTGAVPPVAAPAAMQMEGQAVATGPRRPIWRRGPLTWVLAVLAVGVLAGIAWGATVLTGRHSRNSALQQAINDYTHGQREAAAGEFTKLSKDDPTDPWPHIYLARMAREVGNYTETSQQLQLAIQNDPDNEVALREMGAYLLTVGNYDLARKFYTHAISANTQDKSAQGYLACSLQHLGRTQEAQSWFQRAGPGPWSACSSAVPGAPPPASPNGGPGVIPTNPAPYTPNP